VNSLPPSKNCAVLRSRQCALSILPHSYAKRLNSVADGSQSVTKSPDLKKSISKIGARRLHTVIIASDGEVFCDAGLLRGRCRWPGLPATWRPGSIYVPRTPYLTAPTSDCGPSTASRTDRDCRAEPRPSVIVRRGTHSPAWHPTAAVIGPLSPCPTEQNRCRLCHRWPRVLQNLHRHH
jgi:hypothetical protein